MAEKYSGQAMDRRYAGESADVTYSLKRCIHAEYCIQHLAQVFEKNRRPWIDANGASADKLSETIAHCPSGALHLVRKDGLTEHVPEQNVIDLWVNGPLQVTGDLSIQGATVDVQHETRITLCRCGGSRNKPFCDNAHHENGFEAPDPDAEILITNQLIDIGANRLTITAEPNGPLNIEGNLTIRSASQVVLYMGSAIALCRCGHSEHKPFCDGTHETIGFEAE